MKWTNRVLIFIGLLVVAGIIINMDFGVSQIVGGVIIGFAIAFIVVLAIIEGDTDVE